MFATVKNEAYNNKMTIQNKMSKNFEYNYNLISKPFNVYLTQCFYWGVGTQKPFHAFLRDGSGFSFSHAFLGGVGILFLSRLFKDRG